MKKIISISMALILTMALCSCGSTSSPPEDTSEENSGTANINLDIDISGEWYDVKTAQRLVLHNDASLDHYKGNTRPQPGYWTVDGSTIDLNSGTIKNDLTITKDGDTVTLVNEQYTFMRWNDLPKEHLSLGETGQAENIAVTLTNVSFTTELPYAIVENYSLVDSEKERHQLDTGMLYAKFTFDVTNFSQQEIIVADIDLPTDFVLDYNNGYQYSTHNTGFSYFVSDSDWVIIDHPGSMTGWDMAVTPLQSKTFDAYLPCPELIATDTSAPLLVTILTHYESQVHYYEYTIR